jgi:hypothetical protein
MLLMAELAGAAWLRGLSFTEYLAGFRSLPGAVAAASFLLFAVMPVLVGTAPGAGSGRDGDTDR